MDNTIGLQYLKSIIDVKYKERFKYISPEMRPSEVIKAIGMSRYECIKLYYSHINNIDKVPNNSLVNCFNFDTWNNLIIGPNLRFNGNHVTYSNLSMESKLHFNLYKDYWNKSTLIKHSSDRNFDIRLKHLEILPQLTLDLSIHPSITIKEAISNIDDATLEKVHDIDLTLTSNLGTYISKIHCFTDTHVITNSKSLYNVGTILNNCANRVIKMSRISDDETLFVLFNDDENLFITEYKRRGNMFYIVDEGVKDNGNIDITSELYEKSIGFLKYLNFYLKSMYTSIQY